VAAATVSVVIPCFNAQEYIAAAIESALGQTYCAVEVIVVDDGSTDGSVDVIRKFGDSVTLWCGPNQGGCAARNQGARLARGEFLQFLDADDVLTPDCIATKVACRALENQVICSLAECLTPGGRISANWRHAGDFATCDLILQGGPSTPGPLHPKALFFAVGGFKEGLPCAQEYDLHLRMALCAGVRFTVIDHVGVLIRSLPNSLSRSGEARWADAFRRSLLDIHDARCVQLATSEVKDAVALKLARTARCFLRTKDYAIAADLFGAASEVSSRWYEGLYKSRALDLCSRIVGVKCMESLHEAVKGARSRLHAKGDA
jgi:glycosyltransferase involved in cell wall biosynthesis